MISSSDKEGLSTSFSKQTSKPKYGGRVAALRRVFERPTPESMLDADLHFLLQNTCFTEQQIRKWYSDFLKACPNGQIDKAQFAKFYKQLDPQAEVTDKFCNQVFRCFDTDSSGYIDFKEFLMALNVKRSADPEAKLKWVFKLYDVDGNGTIDLNEMTWVIEAIFEMIGPEAEGVDDSFSAKSCATAVFQNIDANCDGMLTEEEFITACKKDEFLYTILTSASMI